MYKIEKILYDIKLNKLYPIYFLMGDEIYYIDLISDFIRKYILKEELEKFFNENIFYGKNINIKNLFSTLKKVPIMGNYNIVIIKDAQDMLNIEYLTEYIKKPILTTILVICYKNKFIEKKNNFYKIINDIGLIFYSKKYNYNQIPKWIFLNVKKMKYNITKKAVNLLNIFFGTNISYIKKELEKISILLPKGSRINKNMIISSLGIVTKKYYHEYELYKYLLERNSKKVYKILYYISNNIDIYCINSILFKINILYINIIKIIVDKTFLLKKDIPNFLKKHYENSIIKYSLNDIMSIISFLRKADIQSKNIEEYKLNNIEILKELVFKIFNLDN